MTESKKKEDTLVSIIWNLAKIVGQTIAHVSLMQQSFEQSRYETIETRGSSETVHPYKTGKDVKYFQIL